MSLDPGRVARNVAPNHSGPPPFSPLYNGGISKGQLFQRQVVAHQEHLSLASLKIQHLPETLHSFLNLPWASSASSFSSRSCKLSPEQRLENRWTPPLLEGHAQTGLRERQLRQLPAFVVSLWECSRVKISPSLSFMESCSASYAILSEQFFGRGCVSHVSTCGLLQRFQHLRNFQSKHTCKGKGTQAKVGSAMIQSRQSRFASC